MVVKEHQGLGDSLRMERVAHGDEVGRGETELRILSAAGGPLAGSLGEKTNARSDHRGDADLLGHRENLVKLLELLDDQDHFFPKFQTDECSADELVILVAVTDDKALGI